MRRWDNHKNKLRSSRKSKINLRLVSVRRMKRSRSSNSNKRSLKSRVSRNRRLRLRNSPLRSKLTSSKKLLPRNISPKANRFLSSKTKWKRRRRFFAWKLNPKRRSSKNNREMLRLCKQSLPLNSMTKRLKLPRIPRLNSFRNRRRLPTRLNKLSLRLNHLLFKRPIGPKKLRLML